MPINWQPLRRLPAKLDQSTRSTTTKEDSVGAWLLLVLALVTATCVGFFVLKLRQIVPQKAVLGYERIAAGNDDNKAVGLELGNGLTTSKATTTSCSAIEDTDDGSVASNIIR